jgi:hypothetical protein
METAEEQTSLSMTGFVKATDELLVPVPYPHLQKSMPILTCDGQGCQGQLFGHVVAPSEVSPFWKSESFISSHALLSEKEGSSRDEIGGLGSFQDQR